MRVKLLSFFLLSLFLVIIVRFFWWQVVRGKEISNVGRSQYQSAKGTVGLRGEIFANDETLLVGSTGAWNVLADLTQIKDAKKVSDRLAQIFVGDDERTELVDETQRIASLLTRKEVLWVPLKRKVDVETKKKIEIEGFDGIEFEDDSMRVYPEGSSAASLLGFVGKDAAGADIGYFGLEGYYDLSLSPKRGFAKKEKDASGKTLVLQNQEEVASAEGVSLVTHIDKKIQLLAERKLSEGIKMYGAKGGSVVVADPKMGAILGMATYPSFDPREYWKFSDDLFKNPVASDGFEPGSVFKVIIMASALDSDALSPDTVCEICDGPLFIDKYKIETWNKKYNPGATMTDVIVNSDNVGMSFVAQKTGSDKLFDYLSAFGIGEKTGIDLQGEVAPPLRKKSVWSEVDLVTASFGQGIAITPIQLIKAVSVIANGGFLVTPQVVDKVLVGDKEQDMKPVIGERVISKETSQEVTEMMKEAAKKGESKWTNTPGFSVAGKTGTAQIPIAGHYDAEKTIASFIGFSPAENPDFIMLVTLREPQSSPWASETAAPLWYSIAKDLFVYFGIRPGL